VLSEATERENPVKISKAEFAKMLGVSSAKVAAWIKSGKLDGKAVVGPLIESETAIRQLREGLDISTDVDALIRVHELLQATLHANRRELESKVLRGVLIEKTKAIAMLNGQAAALFGAWTFENVARKVAKEFQMPEQEVLQNLRETFDKKVRPAMDATIAEAVKRLELSNVVTL
jgi:predicted transcriptional regulator